MRRLTCLLVLILVLVGVATSPALAGRIGGGVEYMRTLGDIKDEEEFNPDALAFLASYQMDLTLLKLEADVEWVVDYGGSGKSLILPQAYALFGDFIYGGAGIGTATFDGEWAEDPFYALRAGVLLQSESLDIDLYAIYRFHDTAILEDFEEDDLDSITFAAQVRFPIGG